MAIFNSELLNYQRVNVGFMVDRTLMEFINQRCLAGKAQGKPKEIQYALAIKRG